MNLQTKYMAVEVETCETVDVFETFLCNMFWEFSWCLFSFIISVMWMRCILWVFCFNYVSFKSLRILVCIHHTCYSQHMLAWCVWQELDFWKSLLSYCIFQVFLFYLKLEKNLTRIFFSKVWNVYCPGRICQYFTSTCYNCMMNCVVLWSWF